MERLDIPGGAKTLEEVTAALLTNSKLIQQGADKLGVNLLVSVKSSVSTGAGAAYVKLPDFHKSVRTSGGLIAVFASVMAVNDATHAAFVQLLVDDLEQTVAGLSMSAGLPLPVPLFWLGDLPEGQHTFKLNGKSDTGSSSFGAAGVDSTMYVLELMRG